MTITHLWECHLIESDKNIKSTAAQWSCGHILLWPECLKHTLLLSTCVYVNHIPGITSGNRENPSRIIISVKLSFNSI